MSLTRRQMARRSERFLTERTLLTLRIASINIVCPWFCATGILSAPTRIAVAGLPLAEVEDVVAGIFKASSDPTCNGNILAVDAT